MVGATGPRRPRAAQALLRLPAHLRGAPRGGPGPASWGEIKLCFDGRGYTLHISYDDGLEQTPREPTGRSAAIDPGIVHALACVAEGADGQLHTRVVSGRLAHSSRRDHNKKVG